MQDLHNSCASLAGLVLCFIACFILLVITPLNSRDLECGNACNNSKTAQLSRLYQPLERNLV